MARIGLAAAVAAAIVALGGIAARAAELPPSLQDSFRIGSGSGVLCRAANSTASGAITGMFDRGYAILCRDAATAVGRLYALRTTPAEALTRTDKARDRDIACDAAGPATIADLPGVTMRRCMMTARGTGYRVYEISKGRMTYVAEGLDGYDDVLKLALRSVVADRLIPGEIAVATTSAVNPGAFARVQAGTLDPRQVLAEAYRHNNAGNYADSAEFFDALDQRRNDPATRQLIGEYVANRGLQRSNLGEFDQADALFGQLAILPTNDPVQLRLRRNYLALHLVNENRLDRAAAELAKPIAPVSANVTTPEGDAVIDLPTAAEVNADATSGIPGYDTAALTPFERGEILDAQAMQIAGTIARQKGDLATAQNLLTGAIAAMDRVREGRITTIARLRAQTLDELAGVAEAKGDQAEAERLLRQAVAMIDVEYPDSGASRGARAKLAGYLARHGRGDAALLLYREVVQGIVHAGGSASGMERLLGGYFRLLTDRMATEPALASDFFLAGQTLMRPGVADTQAALARELSGGSDEAARLFRQSVALGRDAERARIDVARLAAIDPATTMTTALLTTRRAALAALEADQTATLAQLSRYPRYRAVQGGAMTLADLQAALKPGEAYLKLAIVAGDAYALYATHDEATAYRLAVDTATLTTMVTTVRDSVASEDNGSVEVAPFDVAASRALYLALAGPVADRVAAAKHLIFEPDGPMLKLPVNLLVIDDASVQTYAARTAKPGADPFDFRGVAWLGRGTDVSTAVSPQAFRDLRGVAASKAKFGYLGLGDNAPVTDVIGLARTRLVSARGAIDCTWPATAWSQPIQPAELYAAKKAVGGPGDDVVTGAAFSDTALIERADLSQYRIIHFATHGLVTAPRPACPARPALLTSFGPKLPDGTASDGLLSFREVFDLKLDADLVILSACDTAGAASVSATREAGETSGGGSALDGLVRAFVGAGGRAVLASHWPVPNEFNATERLVSNLFTAPRGTAIGEAMRQSERRLMDDKDTSHPYYWSAFALIGDGAQPLLRP